MYGVFLSGCLRQRWSQGCLHCWARWILTPPLSTLHALCLLQYWFSTPSLIPHRKISAFQNPESLWAIAFGTCPVQLFYGEVRFLGSTGWIFQPVDLLKFETQCNICHSCFALYAKMRVGPWAKEEPMISYLPDGHGPLTFNYESAADRYAH